MELTKRIESAKAYEEQTGREEALTKQVQELEREVQRQQSLGQGYYDSMVECMAELEKLRKEKVATMPVIPKDVAIAIFREGVQHGVEAACTELEGQTIMVEESEYISNFEVSFTKEIDLDDELDLDWMRGKLGRYDEGFVTDALSNLCADKEFECRIHGIDDQEEKKND